MSVSLLLSCTTVFVLVTFSIGMNCWSSSLISPNAVFNRSQVIWCSLVSTPATIYVVELLVVWQVITHHNPGGIHKKYVVYSLCPSLQATGHFLHSLDLHDPISSPLRLDESYQNVSPVHILHFQEGSSASSLGFSCQSLVSGHQIILKSLITSFLAPSSLKMGASQESWQL